MVELVESLKLVELIELVQLPAEAASLAPTAATRPASPANKNPVRMLGGVEQGMEKVLTLDSSSTVFVRVYTKKAQE